MWGLAVVEFPLTVCTEDPKPLDDFLFNFCRKNPVVPKLDYWVDMGATNGKEIVKNKLKFISSLTRFQGSQREDPREAGADWSSKWTVQV